MEARNQLIAFAESLDGKSHRLNEVCERLYEFAGAAEIGDVYAFIESARRILAK
jgi:hypothetical protein